MERRTHKTMSTSKIIAAACLLLASTSALAAGVLNPDEHFPVSRFGQSREWQQNESEEEESYRPQRDRMPASQAASEPAPGRASSAPLGTLRRNGVQEVALIAGDLGFFPKTVFVTRDIPVRMFVTGASKNSLCILMDSFQVRKQVRSQRIEELSFTPTQPGKFRFYCPINGAEGYLVVREFERVDGG